MLKKIFVCFMLASGAYLPLTHSEACATENDHLARVNWNININTGFYPYYAGPYYYYYPCPPPCAYPCPPPYWVW